MQMRWRRPAAGEPCRAARSPGLGRGKNLAVGSGGGSCSQGLKGRAARRTGTAWCESRRPKWPCSRQRRGCAPLRRAALGGRPAGGFKVARCCKSSYRQLRCPERPCLRWQHRICIVLRRSNARSVHPSVPTRFAGVTIWRRRKALICIAPSGAPRLRCTGLLSQLERATNASRRVAASASTPAAPAAGGGAVRSVMAFSLAESVWDLVSDGMTACCRAGVHAQGPASGCPGEQGGRLPKPC